MFSCNIHLAGMAVQADREAYEVGPELLAAGKLPLAPSGMAFGGENGPDPAAYDIMNTDDFGIWQNKTMDSSSGSQILVEASIPGCARSSRIFFAGEHCCAPVACKQYDPRLSATRVEPT